MTRPCLRLSLLMALTLMASSVTAQQSDNQVVSLFDGILFKPLPPTDQSATDSPQEQTEVARAMNQPAATDKTLVAWVCPSTLDQKGGSALTVQSGPEFDAIVFAELAAAKWMVGSDNFRRTNKDQSNYSAVELTDGRFYQMAIVYQGDQVTLYQDGEALDSFTTENVNLLDRANLIFVFGQRHQGVHGRGFFQGQIDDARVYAQALTGDQLRTLKPNEQTPALKPLAWFDFNGDEVVDRTGKFNAVAVRGEPRVSDGRLVLADDAFVYAAADQSTLKGLVPPPPGEPFDIARIDSYDWPTMPDEPPAAWTVYHLAHPGPGVGMPGDPNCAFFWNGRYHLHYIYRNAEGFAFAHVSSTDMVHWQWHPTTLTPSFTGHGMFSGTGFFTKEGKPAIIYHAQGSGRNVIQYPLDDQLHRWSKPEAVLPKTADGAIPDIRHWDPDCWLNGETYYALSGGKNPQLMKSSDLEKWTYLGDVLHEDYPVDLGMAKDEDISCANMFKIGDKWMLLCISHRLGCRYYLGDFKDEKYLPEFQAMMNWKGWHCFAPESLLTPDGRRVMWAWCKLDQPEMRTAIQSLPRELSLPADGILRIRPITELQSLRYDAQAETDVTVQAGSPHVLRQISGDVLELEIVFDVNEADEFGVNVFCDREHKTGLPISIVPGERVLQVGDVKAPFELEKDEPTTLRVFLDKAMVEVFAGDRQAVVNVSPHAVENVGISLFATGGDVQVPSVRAWKMKAPITSDNCKVTLDQ